MIRLAVRCRPEVAELVLAELVELAPGGVEEETGPGWVEYAIYGAPGELPALPNLEAAAGDALVEVTSKNVPDDWADRWQDFHKAVSIAGGRVVVRPSWEPRPDGDAAAAARAGAIGRSRRQGAPAEAEQPAGIDVVVDPGQAFGTGSHPTTRMCLELLLELSDAGRAGGAFADWGTGSGVLAITAAKLGFSPVIACDHEQAALDAAAANGRVNAVDLRLDRVNLREGPPPFARTVTANLTAPLLLNVAALMPSAPECLVCSGMLASEVEGVVDGFGVTGLRERRRRVSGDWAALLLEHP